MREGDLVFFKIGQNTVSHVGVYLTNDRFVHASTSSGVMISDLKEPYWKKYYAGGGRME
jgi:lipoprotein Spr